MILSGIEIEKRLGKDIIIEPYHKRQLNPNSYNLRLYNELLIYEEKEELDMKLPAKVKSVNIPEEGYVLQPQRLYLGKTLEYTETHNCVPIIEGRSSVGRLGLFVHVTAGFGDVGFKGYWTLEIYCISPIRIYAQIELCQIYYHTIEGAYEISYSGKYHNNKGIQSSLLYKEFQT